MSNKASSLLILVGASCLSLAVHAGIGSLGSPRQLTVEPGKPSCRVGERIQLSVSSTSLWGRLHVPPAQVTVRVLKGGEATEAKPLAQVRCEGVGRQRVIVSWRGLDAEVPLDVRDAVMPIEAPVPPANKPAAAPTFAGALASRAQDEHPLSPRSGRRVRTPSARPAFRPAIASPQQDAPTTMSAAELSATPRNAQAASALGSSTAGTEPTVQAGGDATGGSKAMAGPRGGGSARESGAEGPTHSEMTSPMLSSDDPCAGYFPDEANVNAGSVLVDLVVESDGRVSQARVVSEQPPGQGFADSARACMLRNRLEPARGAGRIPVRASVRMKIGFIR